MKAAVERLRWALAVAVILIVGGLVALLGYGRWTAARKWKDLMRHSGAHFSHESDNVTYSQTVQGRTVFTIRAKKAVPYGDGKWTLHGVTMLLYGKTADRVDRVEGAEFQYDEKSGVARAIGEVHIDIQAPGALVDQKQRGSTGASASSKSGVPVPAAAPPESVLDDERNVIHVKTSGLVYVRKLGVAATDQRVEFRYAGVNCVSQGAEFDTAGSSLHLLADVEMDGELHGAPATVLAARADLDRETNTITLAEPLIRSRGEAARAAASVLQMRADGSLQHADALGGVVLDSGRERVSAGHLVASFNGESLPQSATLSGNVVLDGEAGRPLHGTASAVDLAYNSAGVLTGARASGPVLLASRTPLTGGGAASRELRGQVVTAEFAPAQKNQSPSIRTVHAVGGASVRAESPTAPKAPLKGVRATELAGDDLLAQFAGATPAGEGQPDIQHLTAQGHTHLQQDAPGGEEQWSQADRLEVSFAPAVQGSPGSTAKLASRPGKGEASGGVPRGPRTSAALPGATGAAGGLRIETATESGHVQIRSRAVAMQGGKPGAVSTGSGDVAFFDGSQDRLTLTGGAAFQQAGTSLSAHSITVEQGSGNADAEGGVAATIAPGSPTGGEATHVLADRAHMDHAAQTAEFFGSNAHPARLWQAGSQVMAANLFLDDVRHSLAARPAAGGGEVQAVFVTAAAEAGGKLPSRAEAGGVRSASGMEGARFSGDAGTSVPARQNVGGASGRVGGGKASSVVHVTALALNYSDQTREAVLSGGVRVRSGEAEVRSQDAVVWLSGKAVALKGSPPPAAPAAGGPPQSAASASELGGSVERIVFSGAVRLEEPNRAAEGEHLLYTAATGTYVLTGTPGQPPRVADAGQGSVTGTTLVFRGADSTVIVNGGTAAGGQSQGARVHTEVQMRHRP